MAEGRLSNPPEDAEYWDDESNPGHGCYVIKFPPFVVELDEGYDDWVLTHDGVELSDDDVMEIVEQLLRARRRRIELAGTVGN